MRFAAWAPMLSCCAVLAAPAAADDGDARFFLREEQAHTGTNIRYKVVESRTIPLNKAYGELTPEQRSTIRSWYEDLGADDEPPYPIDGLASIYKEVGAGQQRLLADGVLTMEVKVGPDGNATSVSVIESPGPATTRYVAGILMYARYKPARCGGQPCTMSLPFKMHFGVER